MSDHYDVLRDTQYGIFGTEYISKQAAIDVFYELWGTSLTRTVDAIKQLPPAEPQIIRCRDCVNYKDHRCTVANHHVGENDNCISIFGAKRRKG